MAFKTIICPVDGSPLSDLAGNEAAYLSKISGAKLILLHVVEKWYRSAHLVTNSNEWQHIHEDWLKQGTELLEKEAAKMRSLGAKEVEPLIKDGDASHEIVAAAVENRADLIVMASHRYSPVGKLFMGSVIDRVTKRSPCPILWVFGEHAE